MIRFTQEIKDRWLEALESGKYRQGRSRLSGNGEYCCLGVLNEICNLGIDTNSGTLVDVHECATFVEGLSYHIQLNLSSMNDGIGPYTRSHSFRNIAIYIRNHIPAVS